MASSSIDCVSSWPHASLLASVDGVELDYLPQMPRVMDASLPSSHGPLVPVVRTASSPQPAALPQQPAVSPNGLGRPDPPSDGACTESDKCFVGAARGSVEEL